MTTSQELTRVERLDRLPFNRQHGRLLVGSGIGWALDAMDVGLISFVMAALAVEWGLATGTLGLLGSIGFVGMAVGAALGGLLADRIGRRQVFALTLLLYGIATGASALATGVAMLMGLRFLVGVGLGAELPVASTLVSEYAPRRIRGRVVVALEAFWAFGWILAALIGYLLIPTVANGWRWALAVGIVPTAYALVVRFGLPESVRYLESKGRLDEAEVAVRRFERAGGVEPVPAPERPESTSESSASESSASESSASESSASESSASESPPAQPAGAPSIWSPALRARTAALWVVWFCINLSYYGAFIWLPSLLVRQGFTLVRSFGYTLIITLAQLPGYAAAALLIERWGRRPTLASFLAGSAVSAALLGLASTPATIIAAGCALSFFNLGAWGALYAIGPELYPTAARGKGTGAAAAFGRIASIVAPLLVPVLIAWGGGANWLVFVTFAIAFAVGAGAALTLPEQKGKELS